MHDAENSQPIIKLDYKAKQYLILFASTTWKQCIEGLSGDPASGEVFCLSYNVKSTNRRSNMDQRFRAWRMQDGALEAHTMGSLSPEITLKYAIQSFTIANFRLLTNVVNHDICAMMQDRVGDRPGEVKPEDFRVVFSPYGILLISADFDRTYDNHGDKTLLRPLMLSSKSSAMSNHRLLQVTSGLRACANAMLGPYDGGEHQSARFEINITI